MNDDNYQKDEFEREIERIEIKIGVSIRGFLPQIIPALIIAVYSLFILNKIPPQGIGAHSLFQLNSLTPMLVMIGSFMVYILNKISMGRKNILMVFLTAILVVIGYVWFKKDTIKITYDVIQYTVLPIVGIAFGLILYMMAYAKTTKITANKRFVELSKGVFSRVNDSTNLTTLQDEDLQRTTSDLILGLGRIILTVNRSQKILFDKLAIEDAERLHKYLKANSFGQSREYWLTKDRINNRVNSNRGRDMKYIGDDGGDSDNGGDDFDGSDGDNK